MNESSKPNDQRIKDASSSEANQTSRRNIPTEVLSQDKQMTKDQDRPQSQHEHHGRKESSAEPNWTNSSELRKYFDSGDEYVWSPKAGQITGNHCDISCGFIPFKWKKRISGGLSMVDEYEASNFTRRFVVKTIEDPKSAAIELMKDIRHPHVTALLGTFTYKARQHLMILPVATCNLHQLMSDQSHRVFATSSDNKRSLASSTSGNRSLYDLERSNWREGIEYESYDGGISLPPRKDILRRSFVCLSQAISYLHRSEITHGRINPSNILVDCSGSVILADFGQAKHTMYDAATFRERDYYYAPEVMRPARKGPRLRASDVFSLGCVFCELAIFLLNQDLDELEAYRKRVQPLESPWIAVLDKISEGQDTYPSAMASTTDALVPIRRMLSTDPQERPDSLDLWTHFQFISPVICPDCDPRHPSVWEPNKDPEQSMDLLSLPERSTDLDSLSHESSGRVGHDSKSEISSIVSVGAPSIFSGSTTSSSSSVAEIQGAAEQFANLLLTDEVLEPLYVIALKRIAIEKLERNIARLLKSYAKDLQVEANTEVERIAVKFARTQAQFVACHLCTSLDPSRNSRYMQMRSLSAGPTYNQEHLEKYIRQVSKSDNCGDDTVDTTKAFEDSTVKPTYEYSDNSEFDEADRSNFSNLNTVKAFMTKSEAFSKLREKFRSFVVPVSENKDPIEHITRCFAEESTAVYSIHDDFEDTTGNGEESMVPDSREDHVQYVPNSDILKVSTTNKEAPVNQRLMDDRVGRIPDSDYSKETSNTDCTGTDLSDTLTSDSDVAFEESTKAPWYSISCKHLNWIVSLAAEFLGLCEKPLKNGIERVRWTCICGRRLHDDFSGASPDAIQGLRDYLDHLYGPTDSRATSTESANQPEPKCKENMSSNPTLTTVLPIGLASPTPETSPYNVPSNGLRRLRRHQGSSSLRESYNLQSSCRWVFPIFHDYRYSRKLVHLSVSDLDSDKSLFLALKKLYSQSTNRAVRYLSLRGVIKIQYVKFLFTEHGPDIKETESWPPKHHCPPWSFRGCPAKKKDIPLVGPSMLMHLWQNPSHVDRQSYYSQKSRSSRLFRHLLRHLKLRIPGISPYSRRGRAEEETRGNTVLAPPAAIGADIEMANPGHEAVLRHLETHAENRSCSYVILRTPKKSGEKLLPDDLNPPTGWGIYFEEGLRINRVFVFILFLYLSGTLVFGVFWYRKFGMIGPQSGFGGFGVSSWMVALMAIITTMWLKWAD